MKFVLWWIIIIGLAWFLFFSNQPTSIQSENWIALASAEFQELAIQNWYTVIDIRNERELENTWVIEGIDSHKNVYNEVHVKDLESLDPTWKYLFYCAHGNRSRFLKEHLISIWFENVYDLEWWEAKRTKEWYELIPRNQ